MLKCGMADHSEIRRMRRLMVDVIVGLHRAILAALDRLDEQKIAIRRCWQIINMLSFFRQPDEFCCSANTRL
jgi:hypothetical protein